MVGFCGPDSIRPSFLYRFLAAVLLVLAIAGPVVGQADPVGDETADGEPVLPILDVFCFSGSPPLLQANISDPDRMLESVIVESGISRLSYSIPEGGVDDEMRIYLHPFLEPGFYDFEISLGRTDGTDEQTLFEIGFVDFVWGRDNLSFGNNSKYASVVGSFGDIFIEWLDARFGDVDPAVQVLLINRMYDFFGQNTGRCYAFAGTEVRYWRWPDLLPSYYKSTHDLRGNASRYQKEMNFLQFDMAFDHFIAGPGMEQIMNPMDLEKIERQILEIERRITAGEPVAVGFAGDNMHHSMLVFGILRNSSDRVVDLLVANNWKNDQKLNIHSRDAEIVRIHLSPDHEGPAIRWHYEDGVRRFDIDRLFVLDVLRGPYVHDRALLDRIATGLELRMFEDGRAVLVVEDADGARIIDPASGESTGRLRSLTTGDLEDIWFERVGDTFRFSFPAGAAYELEILDEGGATVLFAAPETGAGRFVHAIDKTDPPEEGETGPRRFPLYPAETE